MKKPKLNVKLLRKIQAHITEEPRRFDQYTIVEESKIAPCGTVACIAGWANILTGVSPRSQKAHDLDRAALQLGVKSYSKIQDSFWNNGSVWHGHFLFDLLHWPKQFKYRYKIARTRKQRAKIACERIDHLIATGE